MVTFKRASDLEIHELVDIWNKSFTGYFVDISLNEESFLARIHRDQIQLSHSIVGYIDAKPIGLILNAFQQVAGQNIAWNGGTAIMPAYRAKKLGQSFMKENLSIYQDQKVKIAFLEAFEENTPAIRLYERFGYEIIDQLQFESFRTAGAWTGNTSDSPEWIAKSATCEEVSRLSFYHHFAPWQSQWDHIPEGKGFILSHPEYGEVAYALYRVVKDPSKAQTVVTLYHIGFRNDFLHHEEANDQLIHHLFASYQDSSLIYTTVNISARNQVFLSKLKQYGFEQTIKQVMMRKNLDGLL